MELIFSYFRKLFIPVSEMKKNSVYYQYYSYEITDNVIARSMRIIRCDYNGKDVFTGKMYCSYTILGGLQDPSKDLFTKDVIYHDADPLLDKISPYFFPKDLYADDSGLNKFLLLPPGFHIRIYYKNSLLDELEGNVEMTDHSHIDLKTSSGCVQSIPYSAIQRVAIVSTKPKKL